LSPTLSPENFVRLINATKLEFVEGKSNNDTSEKIFRAQRHAKIIVARNSLDSLARVKKFDISSIRNVTRRGAVLASVLTFAIPVLFV